MENIGQKKKPSEKKSRQKSQRKMHLKNVVITYKSRILKFQIQQKVLNKTKMQNYTLKCSQLSLYLQKKCFELKNKNNQKLLDS